MRSFGIWYSNKNTLNNSVQTVEETFAIDLHMNLWDIGYHHKKKDMKPFIDMGLNISNFKEIDTLCLQIPFYLEEDEIVDLTDTFSKSGIANLVFNDDCTFIIDGTGVCSLELSESLGKPKLLYRLTEAEIVYDISGSTNMKFNFEVIKTDPAYIKFEDLYIRFRIQSNKIQEELFCNIKRKNWFLESGFNKTQVIDVKVNKKRNMSEEDTKRMRREQFKFAEFQKIHFLVMEPANNEVVILGKDFVECRKLEDAWGSYLKQEGVMGDILAYHWKTKGEKEGLREYTKMVKVTSASTTWFIICVYIAIVIVIGTITNIISTFWVVPFVESLIK